MKKFIVTTTIYSPTEALIKFINKKDWTVVVVGDLKTPHEEYASLDCVYISPNDQENISKELSDAIGWNCIQRRNFGFIYAYHQGADVVATVDDDNIPYDNWGSELYVGQEIEVDLWQADCGYFDPLSVTERDDLWHRGYPIEYVPVKNKVNYLGKSMRKVLVQADLWDGDPDIDAMCRLSKMPCVKYNDIKPYASNQLSPFNSQNTFIHRDILPHYMVLPHIGRMDDIWMSYMIEKIFPNSVIYNSSSVYQDRNEQDLITNLKNEMDGYRNTLNFIQDKYQLNDLAQTAYELYKEQF
jgi:hypothetical protein